jgi:hypothetical protein
MGKFMQVEGGMSGGYHELGAEQDRNTISWGHNFSLR